MTDIEELWENGPNGQLAATTDGQIVTVNATLASWLGSTPKKLCGKQITGLFTVGGFVVRLASGGHPPPLLVENSGDASYLDITGGMAVGLTDRPKFVDASLWLAPGDTMLLYSDGLTEARVGDGMRRFDDDGALRRFATALAPTTADVLIDEIRELLVSFGSGVEDDTAVLALGVPR